MPDLYVSNSLFVGGYNSPESFYRDGRPGLQALPPSSDHGENGMTIDQEATMLENNFQLKGDERRQERNIKKRQSGQQWKNTFIEKSTGNRVNHGK